MSLKELKEIKKNTDVGHEYFSDLLEKDACGNIDDYAYQVAYCMSHDWMEETATWEDVQKAVKLGAKWQKENLLKDAVECKVRIDAGGYPYINGIELYDYDKDVPLAKKGDKVKVIIIKEE